MIHYKTSEEVQIIKQGAQILGKAHGEVAKHIKEGVKTSFLDKIAEEYIRDNNGVPSFKGYNGFPSSLCISVNEVVVHGFPNSYILKDGDIISVDCGVFHQGFHSDSAYTYPVGEVSPQVLSLLKATKDSLYLGIEKAVFGNRIGDIGFTIQKFVEAKGYTVVRELVGHGIGKNLHESPEVPNYGKRGSGPLLKSGMVLAIEPMVNLGTRNIVQERDGWTIRTADRKQSAHYEHTVAIFEDRTEILTTHHYIEENFKF
ncbi:type I methionyl aminopeptidase [Aquiflexum sp. LQ15W]|uniref:type I methionyl aminopeptidase n=1 Tax=Cognataquiflexum nitidum TaxID=2922272 RepID=UPI001F145C35|nr:type I methionyl aminopeptidase [Cognataquiflexum nitidum]MCH6201229.1 type I methionyl aminopeptidase [Cognataquiflexum nitidum]